MFKLPDLPYDYDALEPIMDKMTVEVHHDKHHATYVTKLNGLLPGSEFENATLEEIIQKAPAGGIFNNGAQVWNHTFYFSCMSPNGGGEPSGKLADAIGANFGSLAAFKEKFTDMAVNNFGSAWTWLVQNPDGSLEIVNTSNAGNPLRDGKTPLLTVDVWEHAYYIDYRNLRPKYLEGFWNLVNWDFVASQMK